MKSIILNCISYIYLVFNHHTVYDFYIFSMIQGSGIGLYWLSLHTYELSHTKDKERDFYASAISLGTQLIQLIVPIFSLITFYISTKIFENEYLLLIFLLPMIYLFSLIPLSNLKPFYADKLYFKELKKTLFTNDNKIITLYIFFDSFKFGNLIVITSYISYIALESLFKIGVFSIIFSIVSIIITSWLANIRNATNRIETMYYSIFLIILAYIPIVIIGINIYTFMLYTLIMIIAEPLNDISRKVINLRSMDKLKINDTFYTGMLYRSFILWLGRIITLSLSLIIFYIFKDPTLVISFMILILLVSYIMSYIYSKKVLNIQN